MHNNRPTTTNTKIIDRGRDGRPDTTMPRQIIHTPLAPKAIGTYSQAVRVGDTVYISGQIPLDPASGQLVAGDIEAEIRRVFDNIAAIAQAAGGSLASAVKLSVFLTDLSHFAKVNEIMATYFTEPYPARAAIGVAALPRGARVEVECILSLA
jgi:reactive intermediate/imine deaminase